MSKPIYLAWIDVDPVGGVKFMTTLLGTLTGKYEVFKDPVWESYPELEEVYKKIIKRPLSFREVRETIDKKGYSKYGSFLGDLMTIVWNCMEFNGSGNVFYRQASSLRQELFKACNKFASSSSTPIVHYQSIASFEADIKKYITESAKKTNEKPIRQPKSNLPLRTSSHKAVQIKYKEIEALQKALDLMTPDQRAATSSWLIDQAGIKSDPVEGALRGSRVTIQFNEHAGELIKRLMDHLDLEEEEE